ncbi:MAG: peptidoglycan DD-metalloendopeptidase family protein [Azoarcus sp.]|jgi:lipoprotein NlpD|nr:peptidoglycan DD-metalloendopeptidase family protein [Azoarcus sp.]
MNKETFAKRLALVGLTGLFALIAGCTHTGNAPVRDARPGASAGARAPAQPAAARPGPGEHVVRQGETLYAISRQYGVPVRDLIAWNRLARPEQLEVGQIVRVSPGQAVPSQAETIPVAPTPPGTVAGAALPGQSARAVVKRGPLGGKETYSDEAWARARGASAPAAASPGTPPASAQPAAGNWIWPVKGEVIGTFNDSVEGGAKLRNRGVDIAGAPGTPIMAAAGGKVIYTGSAVRGMGMMIIIRHDDNYLTAYAHNRAILVKEKDTVTQGQKIAELGNTDADRPKLHFELRKQGQPVDPLKYLPPL